MCRAMGRAPSSITASSSPESRTSRNPSRPRRSRAACGMRWTPSAAMERILVVVDLYMPERDRLEVIREVRAEAPQSKIIAMSGGGGLKFDLLDAATAFGASRTLRKPFAPSVLLTTVRDLLGKRGPP